MLGDMATHSRSHAAVKGSLSQQFPQRRLHGGEKSAEAQQKRVRMTGSGHAFSDVAMTDDTLLSPLGLTRALPLDRSELE